METLPLVDPRQAAGKTQEIFARVVQRMGRVPKMMQLLANSPASAEAYLQFNLCMSQATLPLGTRVLIAATVAAADQSEYSRVIARSQAREAGVSDGALALAERGESEDPKVLAALRFALLVVQRRGHLPAGEVAVLREAGYGDGEIVEIVSMVCLAIYRNYFNLVAGTEIDAAGALSGGTGHAGESTGSLRV